MAMHTGVVAKANVEIDVFQFLLEQVHLVQEQNKVGVAKVRAVADLVKEQQALFHPVIAMTKRLDAERRESELRFQKNGSLHTTKEIERAREKMIKDKERDEYKRKILGEKTDRF